MGGVIWCEVGLVNKHTKLHINFIIIFWKFDKYKIPIFECFLFLSIIHKNNNISSLTNCLISWLIIVKSDLKAFFSISTTPRCRRGHDFFPWIPPLTLDPNLIMLSVKQGGIKYHFLSLWYDSTRDWTLVYQNTLIIMPIGQCLIYLYIFTYLGRNTHWDAKSNLRGWHYIKSCTGCQN